jgi:Lrp/AsnC family transcriptional regulator, regulator for asnA, asnC and gidA
MVESIDATDRLLVRLLQDHPRASYAAIARLAGVGETTARRRVESLIAARTIRPAAIPDLFGLGFHGSAFVGVKVELSELYKAAHIIRDLPEITLVAITTGRFDILFFVAQRSLQDLTDYLVNTIAPIPGMKSTETLVTSATLKFIGDWRLPLDDFDPSSDGIAKDKLDNLAIHID